ncbi:depupylase/deamidase Dop [Brachybacterium saurashtrense]|uniref:Proteasome accessory factor PafA2 n=1 Tax=Brachybacterium saurashtrense TaxID=556288 RepID=A0A345YMI9_9MICO|nr:depupylase/deamidase Dop [Brachybacterium saurashtrense]AXK45141.1 proteasome accessory factor PafA2 [Brachybacterium saurashtrense]RRR22106.1 proteasome accessory factor PafA2 [Brachybacterium saurashtrense]
MSEAAAGTGPTPLTTERVMGIETEFGVVHADLEERARSGAGSSILLSHLVVGAYALLDPAEGERGRRVRWDYGDETPLRDARGFELQRAAAHPTQLTDEVRDAHVPSVELDQPLAGPEIAPPGDDAEVLAWATQRSIGNAVLRNGARWYVDHAHPEYSAPEVLRAREAVVADRAGEEIARRAMALLEAADGIPEAALYKNNTDGKGASYGTHENYLVDRAVPFERVVAALLPFLATRPVIVGAGRVGRGTRGQEPGFQLSSRADFMEAEVGLETTLNRPLVNTRDEPHADPARFRRLHVIAGDANLLEESTFLKLGTTSLVLAALEAEQRTGQALLPDLRLVDPVAAVRALSHDPTLRTTVELADGRRLTALQIQRAHLEALAAAADADDEETAEVLRRWQEILDLLEEDPMRAADRVEWVAKLALLERYRTRHGLDWADPRLAMVDLQYSDLRPGRGLFAKLRAAGAVPALVAQEEVDEAVLTAPRSTRAHLRGGLIAAHRAHVPSAGWDAITLTGPEGGHRLRLADPRIGSAAWCDAHGIDPADHPETILDALRRAVTDR